MHAHRWSRAETQRAATAWKGGGAGVMTKRKWGDRREAIRACSTRDEPQNSGRRTSRGRFSESWKRLSSRQGSTKRSGLGSLQQQVRPRRQPGLAVCSQNSVLRSLLV
ncbi:hypothetical protein AALO_G00068110 [Alosa alosa]|uniref:Uncharacterized protein n=1 Tax=Alosa alosa TaxID=278164 RepID=A0AAV6H1J3_9TELE|nr:hypothetical protein AALO_G00068110 [Alosa alosa]